MKYSVDSIEYLGLKFRFYPDHDVLKVLHSTFNSSRYIYNYVLNTRNAWYKHNKDLDKDKRSQYLSTQDIVKTLPQLKKDKFNYCSHYFEDLKQLHVEADLPLDLLGLSSHDLARIPKIYWLEENTLSSSLQQSVRHADTAFNNFYKALKNKTNKVGLPKYKNRFSKQSITLSLNNLNFQIKDKEKQLDYTQKVGLLKKANNKISNHSLLKEKLSLKLTEYDLVLGKTSSPLNIKFDKRAEHIIANEIKSINISKTAAGQYFITFLVPNKLSLLNKNIINQQLEEDKVILNENIIIPNGSIKTVGIDVGIKTTLTFYDKIKQEVQEKRLKGFKKYEKRLKKEQRNLSRKKIGSNNFNRQKVKVAKIHKDLVNYRNNFYHEISTELVKNYDKIIIENLNISGLLKNPKLAKHIALQSWGIFYNMLLYKALLYGKEIILADRFYPSSKLCSNCQTYNQYYGLKEKPKGKIVIPDTWICSACGVQHQRDTNASKNLANYIDNNSIKVVQSRTDSKHCGVPNKTRVELSTVAQDYETTIDISKN